MGVYSPRQTAHGPIAPACAAALALMAHGGGKPGFASRPPGRWLSVANAVWIEA